MGDARRGAIRWGVVGFEEAEKLGGELEEFECLLGVSGREGNICGGVCRHHVACLLVVTFQSSHAISRVPLSMQHKEIPEGELT
jgi:hypothetical protein